MICCRFLQPRADGRDIGQWRRRTRPLSRNAPVLQQFQQIVGKQAYAAFLGMLREIGPDARTHRISVVIAAMLRYAACRLPDEPEEGSLGSALLLVDEEPWRLSEGGPETKQLCDLIDCLCEEAGMMNQRTDYRGCAYSIAENALAEFSAWYNMPWQ